ncbi:PREDICTED: uncharacterized protein LOC108565828 [Nicrophorus vespilloides]|uniref:Uncharacterized protein LOC108565828 n=1 Tax=Nicrophorus vespilloides TaxID=110193 RepID=A0ABM1N2B2_NICVS|nr:PREDICTED: uncharacterized protein LOC108565828 [Nicrophorus vespilloides]
MFLNILLLSTFVVFVNAAALPTFITPCSPHSHDIDTCVFNNFEAAKPYLTKGIPDLDIPSLTHVPIQNSFKKVIPNFEFQIWNYTVKGLNNYEVLNVNTDLKNNIFKFQIRIPHLSGNGSYRYKDLFKMDSEDVNVDNMGTIKSFAIDLILNLELKTKIVQRNKQIYLEHVDWKIDISREGPFRVYMTEAYVNKFDFSGLFDEKYSDILFELFVPKLKDAIQDLLFDFTDTFFFTYTYNEFFHKLS